MNKKIIFFIIAVLCLAFPSAYAQQETSCTRKVLVQARGDRAAVSAWKKCGDEWKEVFRTEEGWVGRHGVTDNKMEGDGATPLGTFAVRRAFGLAEKVNTKLDYTPVQNGDVWVDDPYSRFYNQYVFRDQPDQDWQSAENLAGERIAYKYAIVIEYNTNPAVPGKGSAIFLHCTKGRPTAGCVSVPEKFMKRLLRFLRPGDEIIIQDAL